MFEQVLCGFWAAQVKSGCLFGVFNKTCKTRKTLPNNSPMHSTDKSLRYGISLKMYFVVHKICINLMEIYTIKYFALILYTKIKGLSCLNWFGLTDRSHHNWDILKLSLLFPLIECATRTGLNKQHFQRRLHWFLHVFRCLNTRHQMCVTQKRIDSLSSVLFDETNNMSSSRVCTLRYDTIDAACARKSDRLNI